MNTVGSGSNVNLELRALRDANAAAMVREAAERSMYQRNGTADHVNLPAGPIEAQRQREVWSLNKRRIVEYIAANPFHAMIED